MRNPQLSLKDRIVIRLLTAPACLDMGEFSQLTSCGTTFCLAGLILDESGVSLSYANGIATGLGKGERTASPEWIAYERSLSTRRVPRARVAIAARAREIWATHYGAVAARMLPFYAPDWGVSLRALRDVTAAQLVELLQVINPVAARLAAAAA